MASDPNNDQPQKRHNNRGISEADIGLFLQQYSRKARRGGSDPNDRKYSRSIEEKIKRMSAEELDRLIRGEEADSEDTKDGA